MKACSPTQVPEPISGVHEGNWYRITQYFGDDTTTTPDARPGPSVEPVAFQVEIGPEAGAEGGRFAVVKPHFHLVRQFQVVVGGDQPELGKRSVGSFDFHYVDPSTPYGPIVSGKDGVSFLTLRPRGAAAGVYWMPGSGDRMTGRAGRNIVVPAAPREEDGHDGTEPLIERHQDGLAAFRLAVAAGATVAGPDPAGSGGQYYLVMEGGAVVDGTEYPPLSLFWVEPDDAPVAVTGGTDGAAVLVLQFPVANPAIEPLPA
jgi:hypothetical protein